MPDIPYDQGVPSELPQTQVPDDRQNIQATAGEGIEKLGEGASTAGQFFDTVAADNAFNQFQDYSTKLLHGDPNKTGSDGQQDTGYYGLQGQAALFARPKVEDQLNSKLTEIRDGLRSPAQVASFESYSRRYRAAAFSDIGTHADQQQKSWFTTVNTDSAKNAIDSVSTNPSDPKTLMNAAADLTKAYTQEAVMQGAQPGDPVYTAAVGRAKKDIFKAQLTAIGASDPAKAMGMLQKYPDMAGSDYAALYGDLRTRSDKAIGEGFVTDHLNNAASAASAAPTNPSQPVYQQTTQEIPGGMSSSALARTVQIESGGQDVTNASGHVGYGQFSDATWKAYGNGGDPHNFNDSVAAIQRYAAANSNYLTPILGRKPTDAELYLAHQQGPKGAAQLLTNPGVPAQVIVGLDTVRANLPRDQWDNAATMTAGQFAAIWTHKFNGTTPVGVTGPAQTAGPVGQPAAPSAAPAAVADAPVPLAPDTSVPAAPAAPTGVAPSTDEGVAAPAPMATKQSLYAAIDASDMSPEQKQIARTAANQQIAAQQIAADQTATQIKQANDKAMDTYTSQILQGNFPSIATIANDTNLTAEGKKAMSDMMLQHADMSAAGASQAYGPNFQKTLGQIIAPTGDPSRISDPVQIYGLVGTGGLTVAGAQKLVGIQSTVTKSVDDAQTVEALHSLMSGQKAKMSFQQDTGPVQIKDPAGEQLYQSRFVPRVMAAYDQWVKQGKDPWQFLTQDNFDKLAQGLRSPREMAMAKMAASAGVDTSQLAAPPAPAGTDPDGWKLVSTSPPPRSDGTPWPVGNWTQAVTVLQSHPTPDVIRQFDAKFASFGVTADDVLSAITPQTDKPLSAWPKFSPLPGSEAAPPAAAQPPAAAPPSLDPRLGLGPYN